MKYRGLKFALNFSTVQGKGLPSEAEVVQAPSSLHHSLQEPCRYTLTGLYIECSF